MFPKRIQSFIVYGSVALKKAQKESDIDIQIISDNPNLLQQQKTEQLIFEAQQKSGIKMMVNAKTPSFIIEELVQGDSFHVLMVLNGVCLLNSALFSSLKTLVQSSPLPSRDVIENKLRREVQEWSNDLFNQRLSQFNSDCSLSTFQFLAYKRVTENIYDTWIEQENSIQRASKHLPAIQEHLPEYSACLDKFLRYNKNVSSLGIDLDLEHDFNIVELLQTMRYILKQTKELS